MRVPTVLQMREKINTNCYKFKIKDGSFITLRSRWFSFMNPWTKEVEYIVSTNTVVSWVAWDTPDTKLWDVRTLSHVCMLICPGVLWWKDQTTLSLPPRLRAWTVFSPQKVKPWKTHNAVLNPPKNQTHDPISNHLFSLLIARWRKAGIADGARHPRGHEGGSRQDRTHDRGGSDGDPEVRVIDISKLEGCRNPAWPCLEPHLRR